MARLFSHHDRHHVHAMLGFSSLAHFFFRFAGLFLYAKDTFTASTFSAVSLLLHVLLHATSFQFELPRNRQWSQPMIWREFRVHNALFAYRHLATVALGTWFPDWWWRNPMTVSSLAVKVIIVLGTCKAADITTAMIGCRDKRTTNAMPYPTGTSDSTIAMAKLFYAKSQFAAAALSVFGVPVLSFCSILAIEIASFLMTLVRKGLGSAAVYHIVYAASLFVMFPCMVVSLHWMGDDTAMATWRAMVATAFAVRFRTKMRWSRYLTWTMSILLGAAAAEALALVVNFKFLAWLGAAWSAGDTLMAKVQPAAGEAEDDADRGKETPQESQPAADGTKLSRRAPQGGS